VSLKREIPLPDPVGILMMDCDGVLTDGGMYFDASGQAMKRFDVKDGLALVWLAEQGFPTAVISGDASAITAARCEKLKIGQALLGRMDKHDAVVEVLREAGVDVANAVYIGDDVSDLPAIRMVGLGIAVADAADEVKAEADWITERPGGFGAVREVCDAIIATRGSGPGRTVDRNVKRGLVNLHRELQLPRRACRLPAQHRGDSRRSLVRGDRHRQCVRGWHGRDARGGVPGRAGDRE